MPQSLRTIQVINVRWVNATAWYGLELSRLLMEAGHTTLVITIKDTESHHKAIEMGLNPLALPLNTRCPFIFFKLIRSIRQCIKAFKPNIVNCHRGESVILWGLLRNTGSYALVRTRGDQRLPKKNIINNVLHRYLIDAIIATNSAMASYFKSKMKVPSRLIHTIRGGVNTRHFYFSESARNRIRSFYGFTDEQYVIGLVGRFDNVKGQKELITAVASLIQEGYTHVRLLLIGFTTAVTREEIERWIQHAGITPYVTITGYVDDIPAHISALDIGVIASLWSETIARAALEIMACNRPLISTNVGVMPDLLPAEALVQPGNVDALKNMLRKSILDESWRNWLNDTCYAQIQHSTTDTFLSDTLKVYNDALQNRYS